MSRLDPLHSNIRRLGTLIERDLGRRGLTAGQPYLNAHEVAAELGVHPRTACRALSLLAKRGVLVRKRGAGTFVGPQVRQPLDVQLKCIHILFGLGSLDAAADTAMVGLLLTGLLKDMPGYDVQFNMLPSSDRAAYVRQVIEQGTVGGTLSGVVLLGCPREIQQAVLQSRLPAVVFGNVYRTTERLSSVTTDQRTAGRLLASYLVQQGRRRIGLIMHETWLPGDNIMVEGVNEILAEAQLGSDALVIRSVPPEPRCVAEETRHLLTHSDSPAGLICQDRIFMGPVIETIHSMGLRIPEDVAVVHDHNDLRSSPELTLPHTCRTSDTTAIAAIISRLLGQQINGQQTEPEHVVLPVRLFEPGTDGGARQR